MCIRTSTLLQLNKLLSIAFVSIGLLRVWVQRCGGSSVATSAFALFQVGAFFYNTFLSNVRFQTDCIKCLILVFIFGVFLTNYEHKRCNIIFGDPPFYVYIWKMFNPYTYDKYMNERFTYFNFFLYLAFLLHDNIV